MDANVSKTIKRQFNERLSFIKLYEAHERAKKCKTNKPTIMKFEMDLENNLMTLYKQIKNGTYHVGKYHDFTIYEPKERLIRALPYRDRVVHQWYVHEFVKPFIQPKFIKDSFACIEELGTHKAVDKLQKYMRVMKRSNDNYFIVKCDVRKFFYNIDKDILFSIMRKHISDKNLLDFTVKLIFDDECDIGIPIGNYTSQFFANIYLNELDHYIKEELRIKYYVRYMDDFILLVKNKEDAKKHLKQIEMFLNNVLKLDLNPKSRYFPNKMGVEFCGYKVYETHRLLKKSSKTKIKNKIKKWNNKYQKGVIDMGYVNASWSSWIAHSSKCNSHNLQVRMYERCNFKEQLISRIDE